MRKRVIIILGLLLILLVGCSNEEKTAEDPLKSSEIKNNGEIQGEDKNEKDGNTLTAKNSGETQDDFNLEESQLISNADYTKLILINATNNEVVNSYKLNKNEYYYSDNIFSFDNGYGVIIRDSENDNIKFVQFDKDLKVEKNINLSDEIEQEVLKNGIEIALSKDGNTLVFSLGFQLYYYNFTDKTKGYLIEKTKDDISFDKIRFVGNDKIAYIGSSVAEKEGDSSVGVYNMLDKSIEKYPIANYTASNISVSENYVCVTDYIQKSSGKSSGKVILLDTKKNEIKAVSVLEYGSTMACISSDGKYVFAVNDVAEADEYYVMQYEVEDNSLVKKYPLDFDGDIRICSLRCNSMNNKVFVEYFTGEIFDIESIEFAN